MKRKTLGLLGLVLAVSVASFGCDEKKETSQITTQATTTTSASETTLETTSDTSEETSMETTTNEETTTSEESTTTEESSTTAETTKKETKETTKETTTTTTTQETTTVAPTSEETTTETTTEATTTESTTEPTTSETTTEPTTSETTTETTTEETTEETTSETTPRKRGEVQFSTTDRNGKKYTDAVFAKSKVTMINFFEPWCGPCVMELPDLQKLYEVYDRSDFQILGVYSDTGMEDDLDETLKNAGTKYPILHFADGFVGLNSQYVPTTVFIDQYGDVITLSNGEYQIIGSQSYEEWKSVVESVIRSVS